MTTYYVDTTNGDDANAGTSYALAKATLNGAEDIGLSPGDHVWVAPGTYREELVTDVSGTSGNNIVYEADVTGVHTDGIGGYVRITGSDDDLTYRSNSECISGGSDNYRTFRGFHFDLTEYEAIWNYSSPIGWVVEDCCFQHHDYAAIYFAGSDQASCTFRRCVFRGSYGTAIFFSSTAPNTGHVIENCLFMCSSLGNAIQATRVGGLTVRNNLFLGFYESYDLSISTSNENSLVYNNVFMNPNGIGIDDRFVEGGKITEQYNSFWNCWRAIWGYGGEDVTIDATSDEYPYLLNPMTLFDGIRFPWRFGPASYSPLRRIAGTSTASDDLWSITRPVTDSKKSRGAIQFQGAERATTPTHSSSTASIKLPDAGVHHIYVPITSQSTTFTVYVYREADYAGTAPQLIVKQPGQDDDTTTDTGNAGAWNTLTTTLTLADTDYAVVELRSNNTATSGSYAVYFDDLDVD